ncbi:MAG: SBBP repeat-containing protein [Chitinophagaceae bacterium]
MRNIAFASLFLLLSAMRWLPATAQGRHSLAEKQMGFIQNKGQVIDQTGRPNLEVKYLLNRPALNIQLRKAGFSYDSWMRDGAIKNPKSGKVFHRVDIEFEDANNSPLIIAEKPLQARLSYYQGSQIHANVQQFEKVIYKELYPKIDLVFEAKASSEKLAEYSFIIHPGGDATNIRIRYKGADSIRLQEGKIVMVLATGTLSESIPRTFIEESNQTIPVSYIGDSGLYAFQVPAYDHTKTLIIDPTPDLIWGTYVGSQTANTPDQVNGVATATGGAVYATGVTYSTTDIATGGAYQSTVGGSSDIFIQRYNTAGNLIWSTYLGGSGDESGEGITADATGNIYVVGNTSSSGLATPGAFRTALSTGPDCFITKFNGSGSRVWFSYYGTAATKESFQSVTTDGAGNVYAAGYTVGVNGANDIATVGAHSTTVNGQDQILVKFTAAGARVWGTYFGGPGSEQISTDVAVDPAGNVYLCGITTSFSGISTPGSFQPTVPGGAMYPYLEKFNTSGVRQWGTYYGTGNGFGENPTVAVDPTNSNNIYFAIFTSFVGMGTPGVHRPTPAGTIDGLLSRFTASSSRVWATYSGSTRAEDHGDVAVDSRGNPYLLGSTEGGLGIATAGAYQTTSGGLNGTDAYLQKFTPAGELLWGTFYGGPDDETTTSIAIDENCNAFIGGYTFSSTGIAFNGNQMVSIAGGSTGNSDGFVAMISQGYMPPGWAVTASSITTNQTQTVCIGGFGVMIIGSDVFFNAPSGFSKPIYYQWQYSTTNLGPWANLPGETFRDLLPLVGSQTYYYRRLAKAFINCDTATIGTTPVATVTVNANVAPTANTGGGAYYNCPSTNMTLGGAPSATGGSSPYSYAWYTGSFPSFGSPFSTVAAPVVAPTNSTIYTLKVTDANGCVDYDQMIVTIVQANAGPDLSYCIGSAGVQIGTSPIPGNAYAWMPTSGLSCSTCAQPIASPLSTTTYTLTITTPVKGGGTCTTTDAVVVTTVGPPNNNINFGGSDKTICRSAGGSLTSLGTTSALGYNYQWVPNNYLNNAFIAQPDFSTGVDVQAINCPMSYTVTATLTGCTFYDQVNVSMINEKLDNPGPTCGPRWVGQAPPITCPGTTYAWAAIDVYGVILSGITNSSAYLKTNSAVNSAKFVRTSTLNAVSCPDTAIVAPTCLGGCGLLIGVLSRQGCAKVFPGMPLVLNAGCVNPAQYSFVWSDNISGSPSAYVDNPYSPIVSVLTNLPITFTVTITDILDPTHICTATIAVNNAVWALPVFNAPDTGACPNTNVNVGLAAVGGYSYAWQINPTLSCTICSNPVANSATNQVYYVTVTGSVITGSCKSYDTVALAISTVSANAGPDRLVCNGGAITLGTPDPSLGVWGYSWSPPTMSGPYINGTTSTQPQPQVLFSGINIIFVLTVTDSAAGCTAKDTVLLSSIALTTGDAGPDTVTCPGVPIKIGTPAISGVTYSWSPAIGLSCATCAQPTVLNPTTTTVYTLTVTYPAAPTFSPCSISDAMTLTVLPTTTISFSNKTYCPGGTGVAIGGTVVGALSYAWSPATGLSCINCASPTANPPGATIYTLTVTFTNGCARTGTVTVTPTNPANAGGSQTICSGGPGIVIGQPAVLGTTYSWSPITGLSCTTCAQPTATPSSTTIYTLAANDGTCNAISTVTVNIISLPTLTVLGTSNLCAGTCSNFMVTSNTTGLTFSWAPLTGVASPGMPNTLICPIANTIYTVTQTSIAYGCSSSLPVPVTVSANSAPTLVTTNSSICAGSSVTLSLTVSPAGIYTYSWIPVAYLSNPFIQNPVANPPTTTSYTVTVTNNATGCSNNAFVNVAVTPLPNCSLIDYGDAPSSYNGPGGLNPPYATIDPNIKLGAVIDGEFTGAVAAPNAASTGDNIAGVNDEDAIGFFPIVTNSDNSYAVSAPSVLNNTGNPAIAVAWIDWNRDGDFNDPGERSFLVNVPSNVSPQSISFVWLNYNNLNQVIAGHTYMRVRMSTDNTGGWQSNPQPIYGTTDGEVEDYDFVILGEDWGDALGYPTARATVNPDENNDGFPDATGSLWLGPKVDYGEYTDPSNASATGDDINTIDDEDALTIGGTVAAGIPVNWSIVSNSVGTAVSRVAMWIDWNGDGDFTDVNDQFYSTTVSQSGTPVTTVFSVTPPLGFNSAKYTTRIAIEPFSGTPFIQASTFVATIQNGEYEDYINATPLPIGLLSFTAVKEKERSALIRWKMSDAATSSFYELQRSSTGADWFSLEKRPLSNAANQEYLYRDTQPLKGFNYYRLALYDQGNSLKGFSKIQVLNFERLEQYIVSGGQGTISIRGNGNPAQIMIYAANGALITKGILAGNNILVTLVPVSGMYFVSIVEDGGGSIYRYKAVVW